MTIYKLASKRAYRQLFSGSDRLFNACWKQYRKWLNGAIPNPTYVGDVLDWLNEIAREKVNNPKSSFYIHGE